MTFHGTSSCLAFGIGAVTSYKELARYSDLRQLRYDESLFFVSPLLIELPCTTRKNSRVFSTRPAVARPAERVRRLQRAYPGQNHLWDINSLGVVHRERPMEYCDYVRFLRMGLLTYMRANTEDKMRASWALGL